MKLSQVVILCVGDVMLDRFVDGDIERISPEAPVPVIRLRQTREMLGGAGNVAHNIASLGGRTILVGLLGADDRAQALLRQITAIPGITPALVSTASRPTICKTRFLAGRQQVVRADEESNLPLQPDEETALVEMVTRHLGAADAVILSDYGKGVLSPRLIELVIARARAARKPVFVDPKGEDFRRYRGATCITPNQKELAAAAKLPTGSEDEVVQAARRVMGDAQAEAVLATRSEKGMILVQGEEAHSVAARAREVFDVSGAGDTVIAALALSHAAGRSMPQAMHFANAAAGVVVSKLGTATAELGEVLAELDAQDHAMDGNGIASLLPLHHVMSRATRWKEQGLVVGLTNGCFDIIHPGHIALLAAARANCDRLIVALNTDASTRRLKGPTRPVNPLPSRAQVMAAIRYVDCVVAFDEDTPLELIRRLMPDVLVKGSDYTIDQVVGGDVVQAAGGRVILADLVAGHSTTSILSRANSPVAG